MDTVILIMKIVILAVAIYNISKVRKNNSVNHNVYHGIMGLWALAILAI